MNDYRAAVRALQILERARLDDALGTRWALLHAAGLNILRQQHPRLIGEDLIQDNINWSAVLDISAKGLCKIPQIALHADTWAFEAARERSTFDAFSSWYGFLGTPEHLALDEYIRSGELQIRTPRNVFMCSYQLHCELMDCETAAAFNATLRAAGCSFKPISQQFFLALLGELENRSAA
ncbi:hypothetical protein EBU99_07560 [bacterium]|nr:hypothetical protein [bacterium]